MCAMPSNLLCLDAKTSSENCSELKKKMGSSVLEHAVKVRKPYTITKQRERWTEEEHNKFMEALKLYGRAWRQIEEHVGTKTAVQIRSHAQKFFTKVVRESTSENSGEARTMEIPPPRPKRRPMHPYPRKLGTSPSNQGMEKQEWPLIPEISVPEQNSPASSKLLQHEQDNLSPTSVLTAVGSDTFGSSASDLVNLCTSPISSAVGSDPVWTSLREQENGCQSAITSLEEDKSSTRHNSDMELDLGTDDSICCKEASSIEAPAASLKLFGKTVMVADPEKPLCPTIGDAEQCFESFPAINIKSTCRSIDMNLSRMQSSSDRAQAPAQCDDGSSQWSSWPFGVSPMYYLLPCHGNLPDSVEPSIAAMPWPWASSEVAATNDGGSQKEGPEKDLLPICRESEGSSIESSYNASSVELSIGDRSSYATGSQHLNLKLRRSETSAFRSLKSTTSKPSKGFVPYRRCAPELEVDNQKTVNENGDGQAVQLCL